MNPRASDSEMRVPPTEPQLTLIGQIGHQAASGVQEIDFDSWRRQGNPGKLATLNEHQAQTGVEQEGLGVLMLTQEGVAEFQAGFRSCLNGVSQYLLRSKSTDEHLRLGVLNHLVNAFPVFSGSCFSTADSGRRLEAAPSPRPQPVHIKPAAPLPGELSLSGSAACMKSTDKPNSSALVRNSSPRQVAEITSNQKKTEKISSPEPAKDQRCPPITTQRKCPTNNVLSPDSGPLWRPW
ncbi:uncharacterized protein [Heptranchias perlo]|uniref:uncharacterized protein n=1 Tax=Heptranchias perlo TaxID=212740 RepID=UPI00355A9A84